MPRLLTNLDIREVSSVDRGAGMGVRVLMTKRDDEAITKALSLAIKSALSKGGKVEDLVELFKSFSTFLTTQSLKEHDMPLDITKDDLVKLVGEVVSKQLAEMSKKKPQMEDNQDGDADDADKKMDAGSSAGGSPDHGKETGNQPRRGKGKAPPETGDTDSAEARKALEKIIGKDAADALLKVNGVKKTDEVAKLDDVTKAIKDENTELKKRLGALEEIQKQDEFAKRAVAIGLSKNDGDMLLKVHRGDPEAIKKMEERIKALTTQVAKGDLFKVIGSDGGAPATAHDELVAKASELRKADPKLTVDQAYTKAIEMFPDIAKRETEERHNRIQKFAA